MRLHHHEWLSHLSPLLVRFLTGNSILTKVRSSSAHEADVYTNYRLQKRIVAKIRDRVNLRVRDNVYSRVKRHAEQRHTMWE